MRETPATFAGGSNCTAPVGHDPSPQRAIPVTGEAKSYDAEKKQLTVGTEAITLAATAKITNAKGEEVKIADLVGKKVTVSTDKHNKKGESVTEQKL